MSSHRAGGNQFAENSLHARMRDAGMAGNVPAGEVDFVAEQAEDPQDPNVASAGQDIIQRSLA